MEQQNPLDEAKVEAIVASRLQDKLKPIIIGLILLYLISTPIFLYFYNPSRLDTTQIQDNVVTVSDPAEFVSVSNKIGLTCPVEDKSCTSKQDIMMKGTFALGYKAPVNSIVVSTAKISGSNYQGLSHNLTKKQKQVIESVQADNYCYTVIYTLPDDAVLASIFDIPLNLARRAIATLGSKFLDISDQDVNVLVQIQKSPIDPKYGCSLTGRAPRSF